VTSCRNLSDSFMIVCQRAPSAAEHHSSCKRSGRIPDLSRPSHKPSRRRIVERLASM